jgi:hypothetical protein
MAFVHDDMAVVRHHIIHDLLAIKALDDRHINDSAGIPTTTADLADAFDWHIEKRGQSFPPLVQ